MKRVIIAVLMLLVGANLLYSVSITNIRAQDFNGVACRFVLDLDQSASFSIAPKNNGLQVEIADFDGKDAARNVNSRLIQEIKVTRSGVWLGTAAGLKYEKRDFSDKKQIVIDIIKPVSSREERLHLARFYSDRNLFSQADNLYAELNNDFPQDDEILDNWGKLLRRMEGKGTPQKPAATASQSPAPAPKPAESPKRRESPTLEEPKAREIAGKPQLPPQADTESRFIELSVDEDLDPMYLPDSLLTMKSLPPMRYEKIAISDIILDLASRHFLLTILFFVSTLVIINILLYILKKKRNVPSKPSIETKSLQRMVGRLLADGWSHKEIAQELKVSVADVKAIADQPQQEEPTIAMPEAATEDFKADTTPSLEPPYPDTDYELPDTLNSEGNSFLESILQESSVSDYPEMADIQPEPAPLFEKDDSATQSYTAQPEPQIPDSALEPEAEADTEPAAPNEKPCDDPFRIFIKEADVPLKQKK